ncbi:MAG: carbohydrate kinase family protein [Clostridia bacterium]|nr:carbohydrate kinase family protein [Clostridia bacterium]
MYYDSNVSSLRAAAVPPFRPEPATEPTVYVIGAANMDIWGTPEDELRTGDSNPGRIHLSPGGVGRNIAENLSRLGRRVSLVTILGNDAYAEMIREHCRNTGIDLSCSFTDPLGRTSTYLCLNEKDGNLHAAVSDMSVCDQLTPERLKPVLPALNRGSLLIADANLPERTLEWIARNVKIPIAADPVSAVKAPRLRPLLSRLVFLKPNLQEAEILTGIFSGGSLSRLADVLHALGTERIFLSLGPQGVWADDGKDGELIPCAPGSVVNTSGCGDAFVAAAADAWLRGLGTMDCARRGLAAAAICAEDPAPVSPGMSREAIELRTGMGF